MLKTLNLANLEASDIKYKISRFPDGQQDVTILDIKEIAFNKEVKIISRLSNFKDLELIICATVALRALIIRDISLYIPYLLGARSDRRFVDGGTAYLQEVIAPILNNLRFKKIECLDIHSEASILYINNLNSKSNLEFMNWAAEDILNKYTPKYRKRFVLVRPDKGAEERTKRLKKSKIFSEMPILECTKERGTDGKLSNIKVHFTPNTRNKEYLIVDDICDGGRTFINIAKVIRDKYPSSTIYLLTTHGIYSAGYEDLKKYFTAMYCTNSVKDIGDFYNNGYRDKETGVRQYKLYDKV